jgi:hypothetical protein
MKLPSMLLPILRASNCAVDAAHKTKSSLSTRKLTAIGLKGEDERNEAGEPSKTRRPTVLEEGKGRWPSDPFDQQAAGTYKVATPGACTDDGDYDVGHEVITSALAGSGAWWEPTDGPPHPNHG